MLQIPNANAIKDCGKKRAVYAVIDLTVAPDSDIRDNLLRRLSGSLNESLNKSVRQVIIINGNNVYKISRKKIGLKDFTPLYGLI